MAGRTTSRRYGEKSALRFRTELLPRLRGSGADNIRVPAVRESEVINLATLERLELGAQEEGWINQHDPTELHIDFVEMRPREMSSVVNRVIKEFLECFTEPIERGEPDVYHTLCNTFDTLLYLVARGNFAFGEDSGVKFCKPARSPTPDLQRSILARIRSDRPIHFLILDLGTGLPVLDPHISRTRPAPASNPPPAPRTIHYPVEGFSLGHDRDGISVSATDYHSGTLTLSWQQLFDLARGVGIDIPNQASS
jgi:hypothetical protein